MRSGFLFTNGVSYTHKQASVCPRDVIVVGYVPERLHSQAKPKYVQNQREHVSRGELLLNR
eukprot:COSAG02_NODE_63035_length_264_cov_0.630303_1_plen_60_part_10